MSAEDTTSSKQTEAATPPPRWSLRRLMQDGNPATVYRDAAMVFDRLRAPLLVSAIAVVAFGFAGQVYEIYRLFAEDFDFDSGFSWAQLRFASFFLALYLSGFILWYISRILTLTDENCNACLDATHAGGWSVRWLPRIIGAAPAFAAAYGMTRAEMLREGSGTPGLYGAAAIAFMLGVLRLYLTYRRAKRMPGIYDDLRRTAFRMDLRIGVGLVILAGVAFFMTSPVLAAQRLGTLTVFSFFLIALVFLYAQLTYIYDRYAIPFVTVLVAGAIVFSGFDLNDNHFLREIELTQEERAEKIAQREASAMFGPPIPITIRSSFMDWYRARADRKAYEDADKPYPVFVAAAQGGGVYAAYQAGVYLAKLQDLCPSFATHLFGVSGVSGGSVGAATYTALASELAENRAIDDPAEACAREAGEDRPRMQARARAMLSQDFLTPLITAMIFPDFTARFSPVPIPAFDRARSLERALEQSWAQAFRRGRGAEGQGGADVPPNPLQEGVLSYWSPDGAAPALFLNTTEAETGRRLVFSPVEDLGGVIRSYQLSARRDVDGFTPDVRLSTAAIASARFPYFTPAASMRLRELEDRDGTFDKLRLVDGGYFENSGVDTAMTIVREIQAAVNEENQRRSEAGRPLMRIDIRLISFDLTRDRFRDATYAFGELLSPIKTIVNATVARSILATANAREQLASPCRYVLLGGASMPGASVDDPTNLLCPPSQVAASRVWSVSLNDYEYDFQLGWILSKDTLRRINDQLGDPSLCELDAVVSQDDVPAVLQGGVGDATRITPRAEGELTAEEIAAADRRRARREARDQRLERLADDAVARHNGCIARYVAQALGGDIARARPVSFFNNE